MRQLIRRRGDTKGGTYISQAGREIEVASAKKLRPCIRCANLVPMQPGLPGYQQTLCDKCAAAMSRAAEEEMRGE